MSEAVVLPIGPVIKNTYDADPGLLPACTVTQEVYHLSKGLPAAAAQGECQAPAVAVDYAEAVSGIVKGTERDPLSVLDGKLLKHLGVEHPEESWLEVANQALAAGSENMAKAGRADRRTIFAAREFLMRDLLSLDDDSYKSFTRKFPNLVPLDSFIGTNRLLFGMGARIARRLHKVNYGPEKTREKVNFTGGMGLDPQRMASVDISVFGNSLEAFAAAIDDVEEEGFNRTVLNRSPQLVGYSHRKRVQVLREMHGTHGANTEAVVRAFPIRLVSDRNREEIRVAAVQHVIESVGWQFSAWELVDKQPTVASLGAANLLARAGIIAAFSDTQMPLSRLARLMTVPTDSLLLAAAAGVSPLTAKSVGKLTADIAKDERRSRALKLLEREDFMEMVGAEARQALRRYYYAEELA